MISQPQNMAANKTRPLQQDPVPEYREGPDADGLTSAPIPLTKQFYVSFYSKVDGRTYEGQFTTKKMSVRDIGKVSIRKIQLNGGFYYDQDKPGIGVDFETNFLHQMMAQMEICLIQAPMWYNLDTIIDTELLVDIAVKVMDFEGSFFRSDGDQAVSSRSGENGGSTQSQETGTAGHVTPLVRGEVPGSLEP